MSISDKVKEYLSKIPPYVLLVAATKLRTTEEILEAINAGIKACGENYVQEAEKKIEIIGNKVSWHCIGHLQSNKIKKAVELFDVIETVDSFETAYQIEKRCSLIGKKIEILLEINSACEPQKSGILPDTAPAIIEKILNSDFKYVTLAGLMTMGPVVKDPEDIRPYFKKTCQIFNLFKSDTFKYLSMGMTDSWQIAIEENATVIRIGTGIFGERTLKK